MEEHERERAAVAEFNSKRKLYEAMRSYTTTRQDNTSKWLFGFIFLSLIGQG
jgi:hypothetical protein